MVNRVEPDQVASLEGRTLVQYDISVNNVNRISFTECEQ